MSGIKNNLEISLIINLLNFENKEGWKTLEEIKKFDKKLNSENIKSFKFTSAWGCLTKTIKKLRDFAEINDRGKPNLYRISNTEERFKKLFIFLYENKLYDSHLFFRLTDSTYFEVNKKIINCLIEKFLGHIYAYEDENPLDILERENLVKEFPEVILSRQTSRYAELFYQFIKDENKFKKIFTLIKEDLSKISEERFPHSRHFNLVMASLLVDSLISHRTENHDSANSIIDNVILKRLERRLDSIRMSCTSVGIVEGIQIAEGKTGRLIRI